MWKYRMYGKSMFYMPEQFTEEWDYVPQLPGELDTRVAAGKFTWKSNLFQAAQVSHFTLPVSPNNTDD